MMYPPEFPPNKGNAADIKRYLGKPDMKKLVKEANHNGGKDNVSVVMIRLMRDVN